ncbi:MAG: bifunctional diaminohydroxyphosphoribosylaminopyrimidine deaminase/5-amino-6-(5-phosphoribosylamino)uracil reductase RibD [Flavobacteriales bacterium]|nr:bifunctional diaminohydroxyphosphoribosylaminopyrimidine deaminase/5-amino-6-(5-phosphoribosylamino)uracil reductase RibD [Flavobacteriales bacterium]
MKRAFLLANLGKFSTAPNPRVGAVIVYNDRIIGEGFHQVYGGNHAEVNAVNAVQDKSLLPLSTIYVSLEPCAHFGKTPPCASLLEKHKFKKVIISNRDPFEKVNGNGISILKNAGIEVQLNQFNKEGLAVNKRFFTFYQKKRPYIILKWAESKDGFIYNEDLQNNWITNSVSKQLVHLWRAEEAAILVGKNTVKADNPELTIREVIGKNPTRIIIDENLELPRDSKVFDEKSQTLVLNSQRNSKENNLELIKINTRQHLSRAVCKVCFDKKLQSIIVEGGKHTIDQFIESGLWDEARIFMGDKVFDKGICAPSIQGEEEYRTKIESDELIILKNNKA